MPIVWGWRSWPISGKPEFGFQPSAISRRMAAENRGEAAHGLIAEEDQMMVRNIVNE
jgi:hypothetical protein